ncbi:MAG: hypothetical protein QNJ12_04560 [Ilumatobacter sp.]|nr:hypothetical protein [Ilumatobacter sp.]MDJ0768038.1 hypothetical protein [Ilumatobacter sp.]
MGKRCAPSAVSGTCALLSAEADGPLARRGDGGGAGGLAVRTFEEV